MLLMLLSLLLNIQDGTIGLDRITNTVYLINTEISYDTTSLPIVIQDNLDGLVDCSLCENQCETEVLTVEQKYDVQVGGGDAGDIYTLFSKYNDPHPDAGNYNSSFTYIGEVTGGTHPTLGFGINNWRVYSICSTTLPPDDSNTHFWLIGAPDDFTTVQFNRLGADPLCGSGETFCTEIQEIKELHCDGSERYRYVIESENSDSLITYSVQGKVFNSCPVDPDCKTSSVEVMRCATEATTEASINDFIFTLVTVDCNSVIISTSSYNFSTGGGEITDIPETGICADAELKTSCKLDSLDNEFEIRQIISTVTGNVIIELFFDPNNVQYTPIGLPSSWKSCDKITDFESACFIIPKVSKSTELGYIDQDGNFWNNELNAIVENAQPVDCTCDYSFRIFELCADIDNDGTYDVNFIREVEQLSNCADAYRNETDFELDGTTPIVTPIPDGSDVVECEDLNTELTRVCYACKDFAPPVIIKSEVKSLKSLSRKKSVAVTKRCQEGETHEVVFCWNKYHRN